MKYPKKLLPAVMLSASVISSLTATAAIATGSAISVQANNEAGVVPAVLSSRPSSDYPVPERLTTYTDSMVEHIGFPQTRNSDGDLIASCATISGSDNGWDDSRCQN
jgi:hypothetical protein